MNKKKDLWDDYWAGDDDLTWWKSPAPEVEDFIKSQSPQMHPDVLDLGCGLGRHAIAFAQTGFSVTATDTSKEAIGQLSNWAQELSLDVRALVSEGIFDEFQTESFDIVLAYNVLYHGFRDEFAESIGNVHKLLRLNGLFYFTCPTRDDGKYGFGEEVAPHTYLCEKSILPGDIHYFADEGDMDNLLAGLNLIDKKKSEGYWNNQGRRQFYSNWHVLAQKRSGDSTQGVHKATASMPASDSHRSVKGELL